MRNHFAGGAILWITLGLYITDETVKEEIASVVADCGGRRKSETIRGSASVKTAVNYARQFFDGRRVLLVIDSVVLMTTRFWDLCLPRDKDHARLGRLNVEGEDGVDWKIAEALYDDLLKETETNSRTEEESREYRITRAKALKISCGLPLAIASICGLIEIVQKQSWH